VTRLGLLHTHTQLSTASRRESSCQVLTEVLLSRQIEPGGLKNFAAQLNGGAGTARLMRPQFFLPALLHLTVSSLSLAPLKLCAGRPAFLAGLRVFL
jgi:hypothetical protein